MRSAGTMRSLWLTTATPMRSSCRTNSPCGSCTRKPGIDSSLSTVPPVCPSPRPDILPKTAPLVAACGASTSVTLSPTPPLECLSSTGRRTTRRSSVLPLSTMARASSTVSASLKPLSTIAMSNALAWYEGTEPPTTPSTKARRRPASSSWPSRFQAITSFTKSTGASSTAASDQAGPARRHDGAERGGQRPGKAAAKGEHVLVRAYSGGPVDHQRQEAAGGAGGARGAHLRRPRHAHHIAVARQPGALRRRLELPAGDGDVDAGPRRRRRHGGGDRRRLSRAAHAEADRRVADRRSLQVDDGGTRHDLSGRDRRAQRAAGVGQHEPRDAGRGQTA